MDERAWVDLGKKRILNILRTYRISFQKHLEIKISEAGPYNQRVEPVLLTTALRELKEEDQVQILRADGINMDFIGSVDYGRRGDASHFKKVQRLYKEYDKQTKVESHCGLYLEKILYDTICELKDIYHVVGRGPTVNGQGKLIKPAGSEILYYGDNDVYGGGGFDLFLIHKETNIPIGIEAKNVRNWIYPDSQEAWRMIARGCSLECLPVMAARKLAYITRARLFSQVGVLGFETQFQYFNPNVLIDSPNFRDIVKKDGLGYADIKITDEIPAHFLHFFQKILPENIEEYYAKFMDNKDILKEYAIEQELAEKLHPQTRRSIYTNFEIDLGIL